MTLLNTVAAKRSCLNDGKTCLSRVTDTSFRLVPPCFFRMLVSSNLRPPTEPGYPATSQLSENINDALSYYDVTISDPRLLHDKFLKLQRLEGDPIWMKNP